ncbi:hypothetical protein [Streptomyces gobiensis]|uniref:hypothetical protein n=1 Tax=Streptomyces gobiensis TaxID=2875706 RepID=UPI001E378907|nr:hypothetical protein [Streptomyces gobiensis]UGY92636.1 hypothetical protein test1122_13520 [Streptomyces gobiensis]
MGSGPASAVSEAPGCGDPPPITGIENVEDGSGEDEGVGEVLTATGAVSTAVLRNSPIAHAFTG